MSTKSKFKLTSVKVDEDLYTEFKIQAIKDKISFQQLVNTTLELYKNSEEFKKWFKNKQINE